MSSGDYLSLVYLEGSFRKALSNTFGALAPGASYLHILSKNALLAGRSAMGVTCFLVFIILCGLVEF